METGIIIEIVLAIIGIIAGYASSEYQVKGQESRASRETFVRHMYQAVKNRFNLSLQQLDQVADKLGFKLSQLTESARGSARLSRATEIYREFISTYPNMVQDINKAKNVITNEINNLDAKENAAASRIEKRDRISNQEILNDTVGSIATVNNVLRDTSQGQIDTKLIEKDIANDKTEQELNSNNSNNKYQELAELAKNHPGEDPRRLIGSGNGYRNH